MKKAGILSCFVIASLFVQSQKPNNIITIADVKRIETTLSSDDMQGRKAFTTAADKAAVFISDEFKKVGLTPLNGLSNYLQTFTMVSTKLTDVTATIDGIIIDEKNVAAVSSSAELIVTPGSDFKLVSIKKGAQFRKEVSTFLQMKENLVVFVDSSFYQTFPRLANMRQNIFASDKSVVFILSNLVPSTYNIKIKQQISEVNGSNVVGVIPGKSKKEEFVVFSSHYDHLGIGKANGTDSIYNGANDDASGTTAVIELAKYYKTLKSNERTLIFVAFTAEEIGGFGSQYFSRQLNPDKVVAMFNIEMIGTESKWGTNSAYITGFEKSGLSQIMQQNLKGSNFTFYPDPYLDQNLFYRSDNATLARLGVPAHTISTSKMDNEPNYHKLSDEVRTLNIDNMTEIIKSVVVSAVSIVNGKDTPSRVKTGDLN